MTQLTIAIDGMHGLIKLQLDRKTGRQLVELKWCALDEEATRTGFISSTSQEIIPVSELAAEEVARLIVQSIMAELEITRKNLKIVDLLGNELEDIEFLPPTFKGKDQDIVAFIARQGSLNSILLAYFNNEFSLAECVLLAQEQDVYMEFIQILELKMSGFTLSLGDK